MTANEESSVIASACRSDPDGASCEAGRSTARNRLVGAGTAVAGLVALTVGLLWSTAGTLGALRDTPVTFDTALAAVAALLAWALIGWLVVTTVCTALASAPGRLGRASAWCADRITPLAVQRLIRVTLGLAAAATPVIGGVPATAVPSPVPMSATCDATTQLPGIGRPDVALPVSEHPPPDHPRRPRDEQPPRSESPAGPVVVEPGDSLWGIAAERLGPDASTSEVARAWPRWHAANRDRIGPDPSVIHPGQQLYPPA